LQLRSTERGIRSCGTTTGETVQLEKYLSSVEKPGRYVGSEFNSVVKDHKNIGVAIALCYPDLYEIGMSNYGMQILYHLINKRDDALCERVFAMWTDCEAVMRKHRIPIVSLETGTPLTEFDIIGFSLEYELTFTNMLSILNLAGIAFLAERRDENDPLIIGGGTAVYNPEPVAPFFDAVVIGEGEEVIGKMLDVIRDLKEKHGTRMEMLKALNTISGVYVPLLHGKENVVKRQYVRALKSDLYPTAPVVPYVSITHDRFTVEIMRGCTQGCRFCQAGFLSRPLRELPVEDIVDIATRGIKKTGWDEVSLLSLSSSDHTRICEIIDGLQSSLSHTAISLPSLRGDSITEVFARSFKGVHRSTLTIAPEAGSEKLRKSLNKDISDDAILNSCEVALKHGWKKLKLYFMIGLPNETSMDIESIIELVKRIRKVTGRMALKISISPFVPKPHTPFERMAQDSVTLLKEKEHCIRSGLERQRIDISWRNPAVSFLEAVFSRGDRSLAKVIETAWRMGSRFEEWSEEFDFHIWEQAFEEAGGDPERFRTSMSGELPWAFIDTGLKRAFLESEREKASEGVVTPNCARSKCTGCGVCDEEERRRIESMEVPGVQVETAQFGRRKRKRMVVSPLSKKRIRVRFSKSGVLRFISHLDTLRLITRAIRRAQINVAYSKGYRKRPRIAFGPPISIGTTAAREYFDLLFEQQFSGNVVTLLNDVLPELLRIHEAAPVFVKSPALSVIISLMRYRVGPMNISDEQIRALVAREEIVVRRRKNGNEIEVDIRPFIHSIERDGQYLVISVRFLPEGSARLDEVLSCLDVSPLNEIKKERIALLAEKEGVFVDPLDFGHS
jgi:radical SAM family uncharacterized protein/radical SAM-linked protein